MVELGTLSFTGHAELRMEQRGVVARLLVVVTPYEVFQ
jgi:hypothetical protein